MVCGDCKGEDVAAFNSLELPTRTIPELEMADSPLESIRT